MSPRRRVRYLILTLATVLTVGVSAASAQATSTKHLLPLKRGQIVVSLGAPPQWMPLGGQPIDVTLFAGRPRPQQTASENLYVAFQRAGRACARSAAGDHAALLTAAGYFRRGDLVAREQSPFAPDGGATAGVFQRTLGPTVVHQSGSTRACVWFGSTPGAAGLRASQLIPLLNRTFAASVSNLPQPGSAGTVYTMDAAAGRDFSYAANTTACGRTFGDGSQSVTPGSPASEAVAASPLPCPGDGTTFSFRAAGGSLASLTYTVADSQTATPTIVSAGACELDAVDQTPFLDAAAYVQQDGCLVGNVLLSPFRAGLPRGTVIYAEVDGGIADLAPLRTTVDLVLNG